MKAPYLSYKFIAAAIGLQRADRVYLSSDLLALAQTARLHGEAFSADALIDSFQEQITKEGTLLIPTFHFDFSNQGFYDYTNTPCTTGALGNAALKRADFQRRIRCILSAYGAGIRHCCAQCKTAIRLAAIPHLPICTSRM